MHAHCMQANITIHGSRWSTFQCSTTLTQGQSQHNANKKAFILILVALLVHGLRSLSGALCGRVVLASLCIAVGLGTLQQRLLRLAHVLRLALPGLQDRVLQSTLQNGKPVHACKHMLTSRSHNLWQDKTH